MDKVGVAVIGGGRIGVMHAQILQQLPEARLTGVVVRSEGRARLDNNGLQEATCYGDIDDALADRATDAVLIASSTDTHVDFIRRAAAAGKHVLCEKPVATDAAVIECLQENVATAGVVIQIGFNRRFDPDFSRLREMLDNGDLGRLYMINIVNMDPKRPPLEFIPNSGGMFCDFNVHDFDMLAVLSGDYIAEVYARAANLVDEEIGRLGDIDTAVISVKMGNGTLASVLCSRETNCGYDQRIEVLGERGSLQVRNILQHAVITGTSVAHSYANPLPDFITRYRQSYKRQAQEFLSAVQNNTPPVVGLSAAVTAVRVTQAAKQSAAENCSIVIAPSH